MFELEAEVSLEKRTRGSLLLFAADYNVDYNQRRIVFKSMDHDKRVNMFGVWKEVGIIF